MNCAIHADRGFTGATLRHPQSHHRPLVSVLTPSFNQAAWLPDNLHSVHCQTYGDVEHIIMDGGSTDSTLSLLKQAGERVRWRSERDRGQADAINKAFRESSGDIIGWINSDDAYFDCTVIEDVVACFLRHPDADVVFGHCLQVTAEGRAIQVLWAPEFDARRLRIVNTQTQPSTFFRRSALVDPMLDDSFHFAMDYELWLRLSARGCRFHRIDRFTAIDRHQRARKSSTITDVNFSDLQRLGDLYGVELGSQFDRERSLFYVQQRLMGGLLVPRIEPTRLAFSAPSDMKAGLLRRQLTTRRSRWPEELR